MGNYDDFDVLKVLTRITGTLVNQTPIRVGGFEVQEGAADITPIKIKLNGKEMPYIPGSSIKGAMRSLAEAILREKGEDIHDPWDFDAIEEEGKKGEFCPICGIFGSTKIASHVRVFDAYPVKDAPTFPKTGVGINRDFRGAQPGVLYTEEQVVPMTRWEFRMDVINIRIFPEADESDERAKLLRTLIDMLTKGFVQIGARKTIGYGAVKLEDGRYEVYEVVEGSIRKVHEGEII